MQAVTTSTATPGQIHQLPMLEVPEQEFTQQPDQGENKSSPLLKNVLTFVFVLLSAVELLTFLRLVAMPFILNARMINSGSEALSFVAITFLFPYLFLLAMGYFICFLMYLFAGFKIRDFSKQSWNTAIILLVAALVVDILLKLAVNFVINSTV